MNKQELLNMINSEEMSAEIKEALAQKANSFSDELSREDLLEFDAFVAELQTEEAESALFLDRMAQNIEDLVDGADDNYDEFIQSSTKSMRDGLTAAQSLVSE